MKSIRIAKLGKNALTSDDPRDFILNSDYNTPKIIKENTHNPTLGTTVSETFTDIAHSLNYAPFVFGFCKFSNDRVGLPGTKASNASFWFTNLRSNTTNVRFGYNNFTGGNYSPVFKYLATELPMSGTPNIPVGTGKRLAIGKTGVNVREETNPNNMIFDSRYGTLKYFDEDTKTINVPSGADPVYYEEVLTTHSLGYYPFFSASGIFSTDTLTYIMPITFADAGFENYDFIYATTTQLIFRSERNSPFGGTQPGYSIDINYKIYSRDLGL